MDPVKVLLIHLKALLLASYSMVSPMFLILNNNKQHIMHIATYKGCMHVYVLQGPFLFTGSGSLCHGDSVGSPWHGCRPFPPLQTSKIACLEILHILWLNSLFWIFWAFKWLGTLWAIW